MGNTLRERVATLSVKDKLQILVDFNQYENDGFIGNCLLRTVATSIATAISIDNINIAAWMNIIAAECWRSFCMERVEQISKGQI